MDTDACMGVNARMHGWVRECGCMHGWMGAWTWMHAYGRMHA